MLNNLLQLISTFFLLTVFSVSMSNAQIPFLEDFESSTEPGVPTNWTTADGDGLTHSTQVTAAVPGFTTPGSWGTSSGLNSAGNGISAFSSSFYIDGDFTADDWLISPAITLTNNNVLSWDAIATEATPAFQDGYEVLISTTGNQPADFGTVLFSVASENGNMTWTNRQVSLSAYSGQTIHLAWRNNFTDGWFLLLDNIKIDEPTGEDIGIVSLELPESGCEFTTAPVSFTVKNNGANPITEFDAELTTDGGFSTIMETFTTNIPVAGEMMFTFAQPADFSLANADGAVVALLNLTFTGDIDATNNLGQGVVFNVGPVQLYLEDHTTSFEGTWDENGVVTDADVKNWGTYNTLDANGDEKIWLVSGPARTGDQAYTYSRSIINGADDYLVSACMDMFAGHDYQLTFWSDAAIDANGADTVINKLSAMFTDDPTLAGFQAATPIIEIDSMISDAASDYVMYTANFIAPTAGTYYLGFRAYSDVNQGTLLLDDVNVTDLGGPSSNVEAASNTDLVDIFPNPSHGKISIDLNFENAQNFNVDVLDVSGRSVYSNQFNQKSNEILNVDLSGLAAGAYIVSLRTEDGDLYTDRIFITK